jgi:hypothetical protein
VPVLELAFDVVGGEGDGGLPQADGVQVAVGDGEAEFLVDLAHAVANGFAGLVVAADGDVGESGRSKLYRPGAFFWRTTRWDAGLTASAETVRCHRPLAWAVFLSSVPTGS